MQELYNKVNELGKKGYCAIYSESAFNAICITEIEYGIDDYVKFYRIDVDTFGKECRAKIHYTKKESKPYFISRNKRVFLENFLRAIDNCL